MSLQENEPITTGPIIAQAVTSHKLQLLKEFLPKNQKSMASKISSNSEILLLK